MDGSGWAPYVAPREGERWCVRPSERWGAARVLFPVEEGAGEEVTDPRLPLAASRQREAWALGLCAACGVALGARRWIPVTSVGEWPLVPVAKGRRVSALVYPWLHLGCALAGVAREAPILAQAQEWIEVPEVRLLVPALTRVMVASGSIEFVVGLVGAVPVKVRDQVDRAGLLARGGAL